MILVLSRFRVGFGSVLRRFWGWFVSFGVGSVLVLGLFWVGFRSSFCRLVKNPCVHAVRKGPLCDICSRRLGGIRACAGDGGRPSVFPLE